MIPPLDPWTASEEEALEAWNKLTEEEKEGLPPLFGWGAAQWILAQKDRIQAGDTMLMMEAVMWVLSSRLPAPPWLAHCFLVPFAKVRDFEVGSWDKALGRPHPPNKRLPEARKHLAKRWDVWIRVKYLLGRRIHEGQPGMENVTEVYALTAPLWERIGRDFKIGKNQAREIYLEAERWLEERKK